MLYLTSIMFNQSKWLLFAWAVSDSTMEIVQVCNGGYDFNPWIVLDYVKIFFMMAYFVQCEFYMIDGINDGKEKNALSITFSFLVFFSWVCTIKYLRIFKSLRMFVDMLGQVVKDVQPFLLILAIGFFAVTNAFWFKSHIENPNSAADGTFLGYIKWLTTFYTFVLFGDSSTQEVSNWDATEWILFFISTMFVLIIMMNLLISIIGETYGYVKASSDKSNYFQLAITVRRLEAFSCFANAIMTSENRISRQENEYLVYG